MKALALLALLAAPAFAQESAWQVAASSTAVLAAESQVVYHGAPAGLKADVPGSSSADVIVVSAAERDGAWTWSVLPVSTGAASFTARFLRADGTAVSAPAVAFDVREPELPKESDIADIKEPRLARPALWPWLLAAALAFAGWKAWERWKARRLEAGEAAVPSEPPLPPEVVAEKAIEELRGSGLWEKSQPAYYLRLTDILRAYLEARYAKPVTAMTSVEVERLVKARAKDLQVGGSVRELLSRADLVKFARAKPAADEGARDAELALSVVKATTPPAFPSEGKKA